MQSVKVSLPGEIRRVVLEEQMENIQPLLCKEMGVVSLAGSVELQAFCRIWTSSYRRGMANWFHPMCQSRIFNSDMVMRKVLGASLCLMGKSVGLNGDARVGVLREPGAEVFKKW